MVRADAAWQGRWLRVALLALVFSALWLGISLFSSTSSASADEAKPASLLGTAGAVVGGVTQTTSTHGDTAGSVVGAVVEPVDAVVEPVLEPVTAVVQPVVEVVPAPVGDLIEPVVPGTVGELTEPLVDTVDRVVGSLPIVGGIVGDDTVGGIVSPVTGVVDDTLGTIIGSPIDLPGGDTGVTPQLPDGSPVPDVTVDPVITIGPADLAASGDASSPASAVANVADLPGTHVSGTAAPAQPGAPPGLPSPGGGAGSGGSGASGSGSGGASAGSDAAFAALELDALASLVLHAVDDALPSSPAYDTDSTPD